MFWLKNKTIKKIRAGFSLVESLIAMAIFVLLFSVIYQTSVSLIKGVAVYRENTTVSSLANQYIEIIHNLPYSSVGTLSGNPHGTLPDLVNAPEVSINNILYKIYYVVNYIDDPADGTILAGTDFTSNDYKQVKLYVKNTNTDKTYNFLTNITPRGLESLDSGGALAIKVFDAVGQPVPNATINIINNTLGTSSLNLTRTTDANGNWLEVGLPNSANSYYISATKNGYSTDNTYPITVENPTPTKPNATIVNGQVTQISFSIDKLSTLAFKTLSQNCQILPNIGMVVKGAKLIGEPDILKYDQSYTSNSSGDINLGSIEWDNYTPTLASTTYMVYGSSPIQQVSILPDTNQNFTLLLGPKTDNSFLVIVKDATTNNPVENALVHLETNSHSIDLEKLTGGSIWPSSDWSGGPGQTDLIDETKYFSDDGNLTADIIPTALRLISLDGGLTYVPSGTLISSTFDTGTASTSFTTLTWQPTSQNPNATIKFQLAFSNDPNPTTWNFTGPDGETDSYYVTSGTTINAPSARYVRYQAFLETADPSVTPVLTSLNVNYVSGCYTPGQVFFPGLPQNSHYTLTVEASGYVTQIINDLDITGYRTLEVLLNQ